MSASGYFVCQQTDSNCAKLANAMRLRNILVQLFASLLCSRTFPLANAADLFGHISHQYRFVAAIISQPYLLVGRQAYANAINTRVFRAHTVRPYLPNIPSIQICGCDNITALPACRKTGIRKRNKYACFADVA